MNNWSGWSSSRTKVRESCEGMGDEEEEEDSWNRNRDGFSNKSRNSFAVCHPISIRFLPRPNPTDEHQISGDPVTTLKRSKDLTQHQNICCPSRTPPVNQNLTELYLIQFRRQLRGEPGRVCFEPVSERRRLQRQGQQLHVLMSAWIPGSTLRDGCGSL